MACEINVTTKIDSELLVNYLFVHLGHLSVETMSNIHDKKTIRTAHLKIIHYINQCGARVDCCWLQLMNCW